MVCARSPRPVGAARPVRRAVCLIAAFCAVSVSAGAAWAIPAFPGAEGYGAVSVGGRGGDVYHVTSLADTNTPGTLRYGLNNAPTAGRTIVFDTSGTIALASTLRIDRSKITIAGQTAPGDGICLKNEALQTNADDLIIRHVRSRVGDLGTSDCDAIWGRYHSNIIIDHSDASWSIDEALSLYANTTNITVQYCMATESLYASHHEKGNHGYGGIWGGNNASWHHNLLAHNSSRNPRFAGAGEYNIDFRNNVIYNWGFNSAYGGEGGTINMVNNYFKYGPATNSSVRNRIVEPSVDPNVGWTSQWYIEGNTVYGYPAITADNWAGGVQGSAPLGTIRAYTPAPYAPVYTQTAEEAFAWVLANVGANLHRDTIDSRIVNEVLTGTATYGGTWGAGKGIIDSQTAVGGWPVYPVVTRPAGFDTDSDGMPDTWELARGLDPSVANNNGDYDADGYTDLEEYLTWLAPIPPPKPIIWTGGTGRYELITNWDIPWQPTLADRTEINSGKATVGYIDQEAGTLAVGNAELAITAGRLSVGDSLYLGGTTGTRGTLSVSGGTLAVAGYLDVGHAASAGGTATQSGGLIDGYRTYVGYGGAGEFVQTGGTHTLSSAVFVGVGAGIHGRYSLSGGLLSMGDKLLVGTDGVGTFVHSGGSVGVTNYLKVGINGTGVYTLAGSGKVQVGGMVQLGQEAGSRGTMHLASGTLTAGGPIVLAANASSTGLLMVSKVAYVQVGGLTLNTGSARSSTVGLEVDSDGHSIIHTTAASTLGGIMDVQALSGFRPREGDTFAVIASSDPSGVHFAGNFSTFSSNITYGLPSGTPAFGGGANGANYELVFLGYTYGDANGDHVVDGGDLALIGGRWTYSLTGWGNCDFTEDGTVDGGDLALMGGNWWWELPGGAPVAPVPEPATGALLVLAALAAPRHRRGRRAA